MIYERIHHKESVNTQIIPIVVPTFFWQMFFNQAFQSPLKHVIA